MHKIIRLTLGALLTLLLIMPISAGVSASPTGYDLAPEFQDFYHRYGGLQTFGYAIGPPLEEDGRLVQYTERQRLEHHPEHTGTEWEVLLGLLGRETAQAEGRNQAPGEPITGARYFEPTGHYLEPRFRDYWESNGGIRIFGYPITSPRWENGLLVQYTERARFEYHSAHAGTRYEVLLGHLGWLVWDAESVDEDNQASTPSDSSPSGAATAQDLLAGSLNQVRAGEGVDGLNRAADLDRIATSRSQDMAERSYFSHYTPEGQTVFNIMRDDGLNWTLAGETLHRNRAPEHDIEQAVQRAMNGFMNSSEHRRILTDARYREIGIGHAYGSDDRHYFTVIVMTR